MILTVTTFLVVVGPLTGLGAAFAKQVGELAREVRVPILFEGGEGMTRDISGTGLCFETASFHSPGGAIRFALRFGEDGAGERFTVTCEGHVVRIEAPRDSAGDACVVAVHRDNIRFEPSNGRLHREGEGWSYAHLNWDFSNRT